MEEFDPFGLRAAQAKRKISGLTVSIDQGSSEYLFHASFDRISQVFLKRFPEVNCERQHNLHSPMAGTTIDIVLMGLSAGAGLVAAEVVKGMGKDLWEAIKECIKKRGWFSRQGAKGADRLSLALMLGETELRLSLDHIGNDSLPDIQKFLTTGLEKLADLHRELRERDGIAASPPLRVPPTTGTVELAFRDDAIVLTRPVCLSCQHLESEYIHCPCSTCWHYSDKPGKHAGRPTYSSVDKSGTMLTYDDLENPIPAHQLVEFSARSENFKALQAESSGA